MENGRANILFVLDTLGAGGSETLVLELASRLDPFRFKGFVYSIRDGKMHDRFVERGIKCFVSNKKPGLDPLMMREIAGVIKDNNIHIVNTQHLAPLVYSYWGAKIANRRVFIHTAHACWEMQEMPWYWKKIQRYLFHRTDANVGVVEAVAREFCDSFHVPKERVHSIPNGIDIQAIEQAKSERERVRAELNVSPDHFAIGLIGGLRQEKNHKLLIKALALLKDKYPQVILVFVGSGDQEDSLRRQAAGCGLNGRVRFLGYRSDVPRIYAALDMYCQPSWKEGLSLSLLMAMAAGLPIVASDIDANRNLITHGASGLLISPDSPQELAEAIRNIMAEPESAVRLGEQCRNIAKAKYDVRSWVRKYEDLFDSVIASQSRLR